MYWEHSRQHLWHLWTCSCWLDDTDTWPTPNTVFDRNYISEHCITVKAQRVHHLDGIEFTVKLRQEHTFMAGLSDYGFKHGDLVCKIFLLAEKVSHAAIVILKGTDQRTFCLKICDVKASSLQGLLKAFLFPIFGCHLLDTSTALREWIWVRDYGVLLAALCSAIRFVHLKCFECVGQ